MIDLVKAIIFIMLTATILGTISAFIIALELSEKGYEKDCNCEPGIEDEKCEFEHIYYPY